MSHDCVFNRINFLFHGVELCENIPRNYLVLWRVNGKGNEDVFALVSHLFLPFSSPKYPFCFEGVCETSFHRIDLSIYDKNIGTEVKSCIWKWQDSIIKKYLFNIVDSFLENKLPDALFWHNVIIINAIFSLCQFELLCVHKSQEVFCVEKISRVVELFDPEDKSQL